MKDHVDHYLVTSLGCVVAKRTDFRTAFKFAEKMAKEQGVTVYVDAVEQVTVTRISPKGEIAGRTE